VRALTDAAQSKSLFLISWKFAEVFVGVVRWRHLAFVVIEEWSDSPEEIELFSWKCEEFRDTLKVFGEDFSHRLQENRF
jgi:hypothetical protein